MKMPAIVTTFFDADARNDVDAVMATFRVDAVVEDEGDRHRGVDAIQSWWVAAKQKAQYVAEPIDTETSDGKILVRARVSGQFPNSPVTLAYAFSLADGKIAKLRIE